MTDKTRRQGAILRLVREREISTQSELVDALRAAGHEVVQTTVSRDIHELGLRKVRTGTGTGTGTGRLAYAPPDAPDADGMRALGAALRRWALDFQASANILVILTPRGYAAPLADAIDVLRERVPPTFEKQVRDFLAVHDKGGQPCPRCGTRITEVKAGGFITSYCRGCQR